MNKQLQALKSKLNITNIFSITELSSNKIYLFHNEIDKVNYSIATDGILTHVDTWIAKNPGGVDPFLMGCSTSKKFEFRLENAMIALIEKNRDHDMIRNLYINDDEILKAINSSIYKVEMADRGKMIIKRWRI